MKKKLSLFIMAVVLSFTAGFAVACAEDVKLPHAPDKQYTVTYYYNYDGAPNSGIYKTEKVDENTAAQKPTKPTRANYTFDAWTTDTAGKTEYVFSTVVTGDLKLYAQWSEVSAEVATLTGITATVSKTYKVNDTFNKSDITVKAKYSDKTEKTVTDFTYTEPDMKSAGKKEITVTYKGKTDKVEITVNPAQENPERTLTGITATVSKTYKVNDTFNKSDITVTAKYSDKTEKTVTDFTYTEPDMKTVGSKQITVTYNDGTTTKTTTVNITVDPAQEVERTLLSIKVTKAPTKVDYEVGDAQSALDLDGLEVTATFSDGPEVVNISTDQVTGFDTSEKGECTLQVSYTYGGTTVKTTFKVIIHQYTYTVAFELEEDVAGITPPQDQTINKGNTADEPDAEDYERKGYDFLGWFEDGAEEAYDFNTAVTDHITLTAKWKKKEYSITYVYDKTLATLPQNAPTKYTVEDAVTLPKELTILDDEYTFVGWYAKRTGTAGNYIYENKVSSIAVGQTGGKTFYAYIAKIVTHEFIFNYNYDDKTETEKVVDGECATEMSPAPTRLGYSFGGWYETADCNDGEEYAFNQQITSETSEIDRTVFAKWTVKDIPVTFDANGGVLGADTVSPAQVPFDGKVTKPTNDPTWLGHKFLGWFRINKGAQWDFDDKLCDKLNKENLTLEARWETGAYDVTFDANGGKFANDSETYKATKVTFGTVIPTEKRPADPTLTGYDFDGWYTNANEKWQWSNTLNKENLKLTAKWKAKNVTITFKPNGGTLADTTATVKFDYTLTAEDLPTPTKTGYRFAGWFDGNNKQWKSGVKVDEESLELTARWNAKDINISFNLDGGAFGEDQEIPEKFKYDYVLKDGDLPTPAKTGYDFGGWFNGTTEWKKDYTVKATAESVTLKAKWTAHNYQLNFVFLTGKGYTASFKSDYTVPATYTYGEVLALPTGVNIQITGAGYKFYGWTTDSDPTADSTLVSSITATTLGNKIYYAYIADDKTVDFTYDYGYLYNGVDQTETVPVVVNRTAVNKEVTRTGYKFLGWYVSTADNAAKFTFGNSITADTTVYAKWEIKKYDVTFDSDGGSAIVTQKIEYNKTATEPTPTKEGYKFLGWFENDEEDTEAFDFETPITAPVSLKARWEARKYTVRFVANGETYLTYNDCVYNELISKPAVDPKKTGYTFAYWEKRPTEGDPIRWYFATDKTPVNGVTLYAQWTKINYTVKYNVSATVEGKQVTANAVANAQYNVEMQNFALPTADDVTGITEGYEFKGWTKGGADVTSVNVALFGENIEITLNAKYAVITYTVTFNSKGGSAVEALENVKHGSKISAPTAPTKDGFTFDKWTLLNGTAFNFTTDTVKRNITLVATWKGDVGTFLYYSKTPDDDESWSYGYKAEKNGEDDELVIHNVQIFDGMEFLVATKYADKDSVWLKAGTLALGDLGGVMTVENNSGNFKVTLTDNKYAGSIWTIYLYNLNNVTVAENGDLTLVAVEQENGWVNGISMVQQFENEKRTPDNKTLTATELTAATDGVIYIRGSFTDGFGLYKEWSNAQDSGLLVLKNGNTYTFRHVYLKEGEGFKIYIGGMVEGAGENAVDNGWFGGNYGGLNKAIEVTNGGTDIYLGGLTSGWYDIVFTDGSEKTVLIKPYVAPTIASVVISGNYKTDYFVGETFSAEGMTVVITDTDGYTHNDEYTVSGGSTETAGQNIPVTVSYNGTLLGAAANKQATYTINVTQIKVTFVSNGNTVQVVDVDYGDTVDSIEAPDNTGYDFAHWYKDDADTEYDWTAEVTGSFTLTAKWDIKKYTVTFKDGDTVIKTVKDVQHGATLTSEQKPSDPSKDGHTFTGWAATSGSLTVTAPITSSVTFEAQYSRNQYTVTFYVGGTKHSEKKPYYGDTLTLPEIASQTGYEFDGWYTNSNYTGKYTAAAVTSSFSLYGKRKAIVYTITYVLTGTITVTENGSQVTKNVNASLGSDAETTYTIETNTFTLAKPTVNSPVSARFLNWHKGSLGGDVVTEIAKGSTGNITLYAEYSEKAPVQVTFNHCDGNNTTTKVSVVPGNTVTKPATDPSREGHAFAGWYTAAEGGMEYDFTAAVTAATDVYAHWTVNEYKVTFSANGGTLATGTQTPVDVEYGSKITKPTDPEKTGYTFGGWYDGTQLWNFDSNTMPANDVTLTATWTINKYEITFDVASGTFAQDTNAKPEVEHGSQVAKPANPTRTGYVFKYWYKDDATAEYDWTAAVTGPFTLTAKWVKLYTVTFDANGGEGTVTSKTVEDGKSITAPVSPELTRDGYTFSNKWYKDAACTEEWTFGVNGDKVTANTDLYAGWNVIIYTVEYYVDGTVSTTTGNTATYKVTDGNSVAISNITKTGHTFSGWYVKADYTGSKVTAISFALCDGKENNTVKLYGKFTPIPYTVTFDANGGSEVADQTINYGGKIDQTKIATTRAGWKFERWEKNGTTFDLDTPITEKTELTAIWSRVGGTTGTFLHVLTNSEGEWSDKYSPVSHNYNTEWKVTGVQLQSGSQFLVVTYATGGDTWDHANATITQYAFKDVVKIGTIKTGSGKYNFTVEELADEYKNVSWTLFIKKDGSGISLEMPPRNSEESRSTDGEGELTFATNPADKIFIAGNFTGNFKYHQDWSTESTAITVKNNNGVYTFRGVYLKYNDAFKIVDNGTWWGGHIKNLATGFTMSSSNADNMILVMIEDGFYDVIYDSVGHTIQIIPYVAPTVATVNVTPPTKRTYWKGETYSDADMVVSYTDTDDKTYPLNKGDYTVTGAATNVVGENIEVTVSYGGKQAKFYITVNALTVTFDSKGGSAVAAQSVNYNTTVSQPDQPSKQHYDFGGWYTDSACTKAYDFATKVTAPITIYVKWDLHKYTVTFKDGSTTLGTALVAYNTSIDDLEADELPDTDKTGYNLTGWKLGDAAYSTGTAVTADITLTAVYAKKQYTITFVYYDGSTTTQTVEYQDKVTAPAASTTDRTSEGYDFAGWFKDGAETAFSFNTLIDDEFTLTADWTAHQYTITYHLDGTVDGVVGGREVNASISGQKTKYTVETETFDLVTPTIEESDVQFLGWHEGSLTGAEITQIAKGTIGDIELYAAYTENEPVTFVFNLNYDGSKADTRSIVAGRAMARPEKNPTRTGYTFVNWYTKATGGEEYDFDTLVEEYTVVYAHWTVKSFDVTFDAGEGKFADNKNTYKAEGVEYDTVIPTTKIPANPTREGYNFTGWKNGNTEWNLQSSTMPANNITLTAKWSAKTFTVTFDTKGGSAVSGTVTATYDKAIGTLPTTKQAGYTFAGWFDNSDSKWESTTVVKVESLVLTAKWNIVTYNVEYYIDGSKNTETGNQETYVITDGTVELVHPAPQDGYTFDGWYLQSDYMGEKVSALTFSGVFDGANKPNPVPLYARYTLNTYTVTFMDEDIELSSLTLTNVQHGATIAEPTENLPTKVGYTLTGWKKDDVAWIFGEGGTTVTGPVILTAVWEKNVKIPEGAVAVTADVPYLVGRFGDSDVTTDYGYPTTDAGRGDNNTVDQYKVERALAVGDLVTIRYGLGATDFNCALQNGDGAKKGVEFEADTVTEGGVEFLKVKKAGKYTFYFKVKVEGTNTYRWSYVGYVAGGNSGDDPENLEGNWFVAGVFSEWGNAPSHPEYKIPATGIKEVEFTADNTEFKIVSDENVWKGYDEVKNPDSTIIEKSGTNIKVKNSGKYRIVFDGENITITRIGDIGGGDDPVVTLAVGKYIVIGNKQLKDLTAADKFETLTHTGDMTEQCKIEFEISEETAIKIWNQTSASGGSYIKINQVKINNGDDLYNNQSGTESYTLSKGKYTLYYKAYTNWVRLDFTMETVIEDLVVDIPANAGSTTATFKDGSVTIYLKKGNNWVTQDQMSNYNLYMWIEGGLKDTNYFGAWSGGNMKNALTVSNMNEATVAGASFIINWSGGQTENLSGMKAGGIYLITIDSNNVEKITPAA